MARSAARCLSVLASLPRLSYSEQWGDRPVTSLYRIVEPEWLDRLPAIDPRARSSRRDLARLNAIMLQPHLMSQLLLANASIASPKVIMDLGSGDGEFM